jgi:2-polyprenyl-3-methyl-5-hydroxy-6-metoxy-1,4-benzoquinol methylase
MSTTTTPDAGLKAPLDGDAAEKFANRLLDVLNSASIAVLVSIGHQTRLFDTMASLPPATSQQIADAAQLNERYVREWLAGMVTGGVVGYDPASGTYWLPNEHAAFLTRAAGPDNIATTMQFVAMFGEVEQQVVRRFREGGGLPYSAYARFHEIMAAESAGVMDSVLISQIVPLVAGLRERLEAGIDVADVGCGQGHAVNVLAAAFPASRVTGFDFSQEAIEVGRSEAQRLRLDNVSLEVQDVATISHREAFDLVTAFDSIHDQAHPATVLANIFQALRPGGVLLMRDITASSKVEENLDLPWASFLYAISTMHCMTVSLGLGGDGLGTAWGEQLAVGMLKSAGFATVELARVENDLFNTCYVATKT